MSLLQLHKATLRRPNGFELNSLTWTLEPGQHWGVLGPTGSGKSLFLDVLAGRSLLAGGRLQYGSALTAADVHLVARDCSFDQRVAAAAQFYQQRFTAQTAELAPTVRAVLQGQIMPAGTINPASVALPPAAYADDWLREVADWVQINPLLDRRLTALSTGETGRTLLARSLLRRPRVLLLDNPFAGLDADSRSRLHQILNRLAAGGIALVLVTTEREIPACITHRLLLGSASTVCPLTSAGLGQPAVLPQTLVVNPILAGLFDVLELTFTCAVRMRNVTVRYGDNLVLDTVNWTVRRGEKWAIVGPNGSGKSTLLSLITADNPQAYANDFDLFDRRRGTGESIWRIKKRIGFVSPELHLYFPRNTPVWKVVASGLFDTAGLFRLVTNEQLDRVDQFIDYFGLGNQRGLNLAQLSVGQQRWVLLARALIKQPPVLILDEPCQGLDTEHTARFRDLIDTLCTGTDRTLLYVTHYPDELPRCITQTLRLNAGRVVP